MKLASCLLLAMAIGHAAGQFFWAAHGCSGAGRHGGARELRACAVPNQLTMLTAGLARCLRPPCASLMAAGRNNRWCATTHAAAHVAVSAQRRVHHKSSHPQTCMFDRAPAAWNCPGGVKGADQVNACANRLPFCEHEWPTACGWYALLRTNARMGRAAARAVAALALVRTLPAARSLTLFFAERCLKPLRSPVQGT